MQGPDAAGSPVGGEAVSLPAPRGQEAAQRCHRNRVCGPHPCSSGKTQIHGNPLPTSLDLMGHLRPGCCPEQQLETGRFIGSGHPNASARWGAARTGPEGRGHWGTRELRHGHLSPCVKRLYNHLKHLGRAQQGVQAPPPSHPEGLDRRICSSGAQDLHTPSLSSIHGTVCARAT